MNVKYRDGWRKGSIRGGLVALAVASAGLLLAGFAAGFADGPRMMGGGLNYHSTRGSCTPPANLSGRIVKVTLGDMGMGQMMGGNAPFASRMRLFATPTRFTAGRVNIVAANFGWRTHELVVLPLPDGQAAGQRVSGSDGKIDEAGSLAEASNNCGAGVGEGVEPGSMTWTTVTLAPGRYEFVCNLPNHYANGMYQEVLVTTP